MANENSSSGVLDGEAKAYQATGGVLELPIEYIVEDTEISYSDNVVIQHLPDRFIISFFQHEHPVILSEEQLERQTTARFFPVARIALTPREALEFSQSLQDNVEKWLAKYGKKA
jgi:hypothetical protein